MARVPYAHQKEVPAPVGFGQDVPSRMGKGLSLAAALEMGRLGTLRTTFIIPSIIALLRTFEEHRGTYERVR